MIRPARPLLVFVLLALAHVSNAQCWRQVVIGQRHSAAVGVDGSLWTWGWNDAGQLGSGTNTPVNFPQQVGTDLDWATVSVAREWDIALAEGGIHSAAIKVDGSLWTWGSNSHGQLGDGTTDDHSAPAQVGAGNIWKDVRCGPLHTIALRSDSTLWAWGYNFYGQLGTGNTVEVHVPTQVGTASNWWRIATSENHCLALKSDGSLWSWGLNNYYQLGFYNDNNNKVVPTHVGSSTAWRSIDAGTHYSMALKNDSTLWSWGRNDYGQLGLGMAGGYHPVPQQVGTESTWQAVSCGDGHTLAQRTDGTLWGWGFNYFGQLGQNNTTWNFPSPQNIPSGAGSRAISAGNHGSSSLRVDSTLWCWGNNPEGALGVGDQVQHNVPVPVVCSFSTSLNVATPATLRFHPQPTAGPLQLDRIVDEAQVCDMNGRILFTQRNTAYLDLSFLPDGPYLLRASVSGSLVHVRVVKR